MIPTSNRGFAEWGGIFGDPVVATALPDRLRNHADLMPEHVRATAPITPPPPKRKRGRPGKENSVDV